MIASELGSSGACETFWCQARWSGSEAALAGTSGPGRGKTPHSVPSDDGGFSLELGAATASAVTPARATATVAINARVIICLRPPSELGRGLQPYPYDATGRLGSGPR